MSSLLPLKTEFGEGEPPLPPKLDEKLEHPRVIVSSQFLQEPGPIDNPAAPSAEKKNS